MGSGTPFVSRPTVSRTVLDRHSPQEFIVKMGLHVRVSLGLCVLMLRCFTAASFAVDGVVLIDQNRALAGNVTPGDAPVFPVTLSVRGSYRLSSSLIVPAETDGIVIAADGVSVD